MTKRIDDLCSKIIRRALPDECAIVEQPIDQELVLELAQSSDLLVTVEDNVRLGGAGSAVIEVLAQQHHLVPVLNLGLPDHFVEHGSREELLAQCGLDGSGILRAIQKRIRAKDLDERAQRAN